MQALETSKLNNVVLQAPLLGFQRQDAVDVFEKSHDRVCRRARCVRHAPEDLGRGKVVSLHCETQPHLDDGARK